MIIAHPLPEGHVALTRPAYGDLWHGLDDEALRQHVVEKLSLSEFILVEEKDLPDGEADFFEAMRLVDGALVIDMPAAREMFRERIRQARAPKLAALDIVFQRALEAGNATDHIVAEKQRLRDLTADPRIEASQSVVQLRSFWPDLGLD